MIPVVTTPIMAVFFFHVLGCAHQPPEGDHTPLGYS
jgi:hypothetical protein